MKRIFISCGAHKLGILKQLNEVSKIRAYDKFYLKEWDEIYCFEPNKKFPDWIEYYGSPFENVTYINKAVWTENIEGARFYEMHHSFDYGNTMCPEKGGQGRKATNDADTIDFDKWLKENINKEDYVFLDMDIECAEYKVIPHLIKNGSIDLIDDFAIEWHTKKCGSWNPGENLNGENLHDKLVDELKEHTNVLNHNQIGLG